MNSLESVVGRQGVFRSNDLIGYELLFRGTASRAGRTTSSEMTAEVIFSALNIGLNVLAGDKLLFCKAGRDILTGAVPIVLPPDRTVIEIQGSVEIDAAVESGVAALAKAGYGIALDDFGGDAGSRRLLPYASIVKINLMLTSSQELTAVLDSCRQFDVELLAEKIENWNSVPDLAALGFTLFQGFALERPKVISGHSLAAADLNGLRAAVETFGSEADFDQYEQLIRRDPALAHQIMRMASYGRLGDARRTISSVRQAMVVAGLDAVQRWLTLLLARPTTSRGRDDALINVLIRARACELLAGELPEVDNGMAFTAGLLAAFDEVLEIPTADIAEELALSAELRDAVLGGSSPLGQLVNDVTDYRYRPGKRTAGDQPRSGLSVDEFDTAFAAAFGWAFDTLAATTA